MPNILDTHVGAYEGGNIYDFDNEIILTWYPQRILELTGGARSLLELGLGHGFATRAFAGHFARHVVLDGSAAVIANFRRLQPDHPAEIVETYFETFDTPERFDVIVLGFVLEHVDDPRLVMRRFQRFLAPGGRMYVAVPNAEVLNRRLGHAAGMLPDMSALSPNDLLLGHKRYYTVESLQADVRSAGLAATRIEGIYLKPLATSQMLALKLDPAILRALCTVGIGYPELSCGILMELSSTG